MGVIVDVTSDVICPWCYIGKRRLERAVDGLGGRHEVHVRWHPFQLNPQMPQEGKDRRAYRTAKFGSWERSQALDAQVAAAGEAEGIHFAFERIGRTPNTLDAHRLIALAGERGVQDAVVEALFRGYFTEGRDIDDRGTLLDLAVQAGLDGGRAESLLDGDEGLESLRAAEEQSRRLGVRGVPFFVINGEVAISGAQEPKAFLDAFDRASAGGRVGEGGVCTIGPGMEDRGAGIVLQPEVAGFLARFGVAPPEMLVVPVRTRRYLATDGSVAQEGPMPQAMFSWDMLYRKLRAAFGEGRYHVGVRLIGFEAAGDRVTARFEGGRGEVCDLLVGADGPGSTVRRQLLPEVRSEYAGYVAWRGVVPEGQAPELASELAGRFTFFQAPHTHILCYLIPGPDGSLTPGRRRINWVWYLNAAPGDELDRVLTDRDGRRREYSVPQGLVAPGMVGWLHGQARRILPPQFVRLVEATAGPFVQTIHDLGVPRMAFGRACLTGDAAFVPRPHTAASTAKAAANALDLAYRLEAVGGDVGEALRRWEPGQLDVGRRLGMQGRRLGDRSQFGR